MKKFISIICLLTMIFSLFSGLSVFAEAKGDLEINVEEADGIIDVSVKVKNATFKVFQTALRYDKEVIAPLDKDGAVASRYRGFASYNEELDFFSFVGEKLEAEKGLFGWTMYIMPTEEHELLNDDKEFSATKDGVELVSFKFKRLKEGSPNFEIALQDDVKPYQPALREGILLIGKAGTYDVNVSYIYGEEKTEQEIIYENPALAEKEEVSEETPSEDETEVKEGKENKEDKKEITSLERKQDVICLKIGQSRTITFDKKKFIDDKNDKVVPYIVNDRTLVPLRFISEALGADVLWEDGWDGCIIKKGETEIKITFGSAEFEVNGEKFTYEAPIEVAHDRTMVPVRFVSEVLEQDVYWDGGNELVIISPKDNPWVETRQAEKTAIDEMLISILGIL